MTALRPVIALTVAIVATVLAVRAANADLLVMSNLTKSVLRYDETTGAFLGVFAGPAVVQSPFGPANVAPTNGMAFGSDGNLYVIGNHDFLSTVVMRYDGRTGAFIDIFAFPPGGYYGVYPIGDLVFGPDGNLWVVGNNPLLRYDGTTGAVMNVFPGIGGFPVGLTLGPDGDLYMTTLTAGFELLRFDGTTGALKGIAAGGLLFPKDVTFGPDGNLYVTGQLSNNVVRFHAWPGGDNNAFEVFVPGGSGGLLLPGGVAFGPDGNLYVSSIDPSDFSSGSVLRFNGRTGAFIDTFVPPGSGGLKLDASQGGVLTGFLVFTPRPLAPPAPIMDDNFDDNSLDPARWAVLRPPPGFSAAVTETNQRLEVSVGPGAGGGGVVSQCVVSGDFDVQVDFALLNWPPFNSHSVRLGATDFGIVSSSGIGSYGIGMERSSFEVERYVMVLTGEVAHVATSETTGRLRLRRVGSTLSGYFHNGSDWVLVGSGPTNPFDTLLNGTGATRLNLDIGTRNSTAPGGITVAFDNFRVNAGRVNCPATSFPSISIGAVVQATANLDVRIGPSIYQPDIFIEPAGALGIVIEGPVSADGFTWWPINYDDGISGWSVGDFLVIAPNAPPPRVLPYAPAPISAGVRVQTTVNVNVRSGPSVYQPAIFTEPVGSLGTVIAGSVSADGYTWWQVSYDNGVIGWSAENELIVVIPVSSPGPQAPVLSVAPASLAFGSVTVGSSKDLSFTVTNSGGGTLSGTASTQTPFSIVEGSPFSLAAGVSQAVRVRFSPTPEGEFSNNVRFVSDGGVLSRAITGQGLAAAPIPQIQSVLPVLGPIGTAITIGGRGFGPDARSVRFGSSTADVLSWAESEIVTVVPPLVPGTYPVVVTTSGGTSNASSFLVTSGVVAGDFRLLLAPSVQVLPQGASTVYRVLIEPTNGYARPVSLSVAGLRDGVTAVFTENPVLPSQGTDLVLTAAPDAARGPRALTVQGSSGSLLRSASAEVRIRRAIGSTLGLRRSFTDEKPLLLTFRDRQQTANEVTASVTLWNLTGTWLKATLNINAGTFPVNVNEGKVPAVILLGPFAAKDLGRITFGEGQFLQYDADRTSFEPTFALIIDLFLRGTIGREVAPDLFFNAYSGVELARNLFGEVLRVIEIRCPMLAIRVGADIAVGDATAILEDLALFLNCTGEAGPIIRRFFMRILGDPLQASLAASYLETSLEGIIGLLQLPEHLVLFGNLMCPSLGRGEPIGGYIEALGLCNSVGSPLSGSVRLEAIP